MAGVAYLFGFGAIYLTYPTSVGVRVPGAVASLITATVFGAAVVFSLVVGARAGHGVSGPSRVVAAMYGWAWVLGFSVLIAVNYGVARQPGVSEEAATLLWSGSAPLLVGLLYLAGGALWRDRFQYGLGVWMMITGAVSVFAGVPANFAVLALGGGGGLLLVAGYAARRRH